NLALNGANTFTGNVNIVSGRVQVGNAQALGTGAGKTTVSAAGTLQFTAAGTYSEAIDFAGTGFTEPATGFGAIRVNDVPVTLSGTLTMTGNARIYTAATTAANMPTTISGAIGETGGARNLTLAGPGTWSLTAANTYTGTTTVSLGTVNLNGTGSLT